MWNLTFTIVSERKNDEAYIYLLNAMLYTSMTLIRIYRQHRFVIAKYNKILLTPVKTTYFAEFCVPSHDAAYILHYSSNIFNMFLTAFHKEYTYDISRMKTTNMVL